MLYVTSTTTVNLHFTQQPCAHTKALPGCPARAQVHPAWVMLFSVRQWPGWQHSIMWVARLALCMIILYRLLPTAFVNVTHAE